MLPATASLYHNHSHWSRILCIFVKVWTSIWTHRLLLVICNSISPIKIFHCQFIFGIYLSVGMISDINMYAYTVLLVQALSWYSYAYHTEIQLWFGPKFLLHQNGKWNKAAVPSNTIKRNKIFGKDSCVVSFRKGLPVNATQKYHKTAGLHRNFE